MPIPINPYVAGNPVGGSPAFIGRADVLREVLRILRRPQDNAIVLYGQRRIGKTSILQHLTTQLPKEGNYCAIYFDLQDKAAWPLGRVLSELARTIADKLNQPTPDLGAEPETAFRQTWLPDVLSKLPAGYALVLLFDEFDVLADPQAEQAAAAFFPYLRDLMASDPQRLKFVFVIGRNVNDLPSNTLSLFKGLPAQRVSLLSEPDTAELVHLSQKNGTLTWPDDAVARVWQLSHGHPFLTQRLCSHVWERAYDQEPDQTQTVTSADVEAAVPDALEANRNMMEWLWDGLPPAERVVISALAEAGPGCITQEELERLLRESGVRVLIRELQNAPQLLQEWDLIEPAEGGYCFRVELLRQWIAANKPLRRVQDELDRVEPVAESYYQAALGLYRGQQLDQAVDPLQRAIGLNPNHVGANQLLADILLAHGKPDEAIQLLERLYEYQPVTAKPRLVQTLLAKALSVTNENDELALYERVLALDATQTAATIGKKRIWQQRGDSALKSDDLEAALKAYQTGGLTEKVAEIEQEKRRRELAARMQELEELEDKKQYQGALDLARRLANEYQETKNWTTDLERLERKIHLAELYQRALGALQSDDRKMAETLLVQVVALEPEYEEATRYLHLAVAGVDVAELQARLEGKTAQRKIKPAASREAQTARQPKKIQPDAQKEAESQLQTEIAQPSKVTSGQRRLSPWKPLDHLRLLWWVLITPQQLKTYRETFGERDEHRVGSWLVSTLTWLPLLIPTLALELGTLPGTSVASPSAYLYSCLGLLLAWALTGMLGKSTKPWVGVVAGITAVGVAGVVAGVAAEGVAFGVAFDVAGGVFGMALGAAVGAAVGVAVGVAGVVAGGVALGAAVGVALGVGFGAAGVVVFGAAGVVAGVVAVGVDRSLKTGTASPWVQVGEDALTLSYAFLVWFCFLGGWRVFSIV
jgi:tetratricopeptide (TPR) repeat protein